MPRVSRKPASPAESRPDGITPRLLTIPQAAAYCSATIWSIRELLWSGTIPYLTFGKRFVIARPDLDSYIDSQLQLASDKRDAANARLAARVARASA